jgi:hypothetical protein
MNSKRVGGDYERECAKKLSEWLTGSNEKLVCWRASHSGSVSTNRLKKGLKGDNVAGDFQCLDLEYSYFFDNFFIDSKSLTGINLFMINEKNQKSNKLFQEWKKVVSDADKNLKIPMMLVKVRDDRSIPEFIMLPCQYNIMELILDFNIAYMEYNFIGTNCLECVIIPQDIFFEKIKINHIKNRI